MEEGQDFEPLARSLERHVTRTALHVVEAAKQSFSSSLLHYNAKLLGYLKIIQHFFKIKISYLYEKVSYVDLHLKFLSHTSGGINYPHRTPVSFVGCHCVVFSFV